MLSSRRHFEVLGLEREFVPDERGCPLFAKLRCLDLAAMYGGDRQSVLGVALERAAVTGVRVDVRRQRARWR